MQLPNMELNNRTCEALSSHGIAETLTYLFLKPCLGSASTCKMQPYFQYLSSCFELSLGWLNETSEIVFDYELENPLEKLLNYLIQNKRAGWKPKMVFLKSMQDNISDENDIISLIELSKVTKTGIPYTAYKVCHPRIWEEVFLVGQAAGFYCRGITVDFVDFQALKNQTVLPVTICKKAKNLWYPAVEKTNLHFNEKIKDLLETLKITATQATELYYSQD